MRIRQRKGIILGVAGILTLGIAGGGWAVLETAEEQGVLAPVQQAQLAQLTGRIATVDMDAKMVTLKTGWFSSTRLAVDWRTGISKSGQPASLEDLKPGDRATVEFAEEGDKKVASSIVIEEEQVKS